jgi:hypothetical protein
VWGFVKDNWTSILPSIFTTATSTAALDKAVRLFEVLTIDNPD